MPPAPAADPQWHHNHPTLIPGSGCHQHNPRQRAAAHTASPMAHKAAKRRLTGEDLLQCGFADCGGGNLSAEQRPRYHMPWSSHITESQSASLSQAECVSVSFVQCKYIAGNRRVL